MINFDPQEFAASIANKSKKLEDRLQSKSMKLLNSMQKKEEKIYSKMLHTKDSLIAKAKLAELTGNYAVLKDKLKKTAIANKAKQYIPYLDSLSVSLKLLNKNDVGGKVKDALAQTGSLQDKFQQAEEIKNFIKERREELKQQLENLGMVKQLKQINKHIYYYAEQIKEYKEILKEPKKIEKKALELLSKTKVFQEFIKKNSMLASLFQLPDDPSSQAGLAGLQTRVQVNNMVQTQLAAGGPNAQQQFQASMQDVQSQLQQLKNKIDGSGGSSDDEMPNFKPNEQKTKSFMQRLEYGTNLQKQKSTVFFPATTDIGLSVGYKINNKSVIGIGASYKMGLGNGWRDIRISHQGVGLRSYVDIKVKGNLWISSGFEMNYRSAFKSIDQLKDLNDWHQSGLIGLSKKYQVSRKIKGKMQLLWDFMSYQQTPRTQSIIFRIGYSLK